MFSSVWSVVDTPVDRRYDLLEHSICNVVRASGTVWHWVSALHILCMSWVSRKTEIPPRFRSPINLPRSGAISCLWSEAYSAIAVLARRCINRRVSITKHTSRYETSTKLVRVSARHFSCAFSLSFSFLFLLSSFRSPDQEYYPLFLALSSPPLNWSSYSGALCNGCKRFLLLLGREVDLWSQPADFQCCLCADSTHDNFKRNGVCRRRGAAEQGKREKEKEKKRRKKTEEAEEVWTGEGNSRNMVPCVDVSNDADSNFSWVWTVTNDASEQHFAVTIDYCMHGPTFSGLSGLSRSLKRLLIQGLSSKA